MRKLSLVVVKRNRNSTILFLAIVTIIGAILSTEAVASPLHDAAMYGNERQLSFLIARGYDVEQADKHGQTALMIASLKGHLNIVQELLKAGADPNGKSATGFTALMSAAVGTSDSAIEIMRLLIKKGADVNAQAIDGGSALTCAISSSDANKIKLLIENGADVNALDETGTPVQHALISGSPEILKMIFAAGADSSINSFRTMQIASIGPCIDCLDVLIKNGWDVNASREGETVLHAAIEMLSVRSAEALILNGADIRSTESAGFKTLYREGSTPLTFAADNGSIILVRFLIDKGAKINKQDIRGNTALMYAATGHHEDIVRYLMRHGADPNIKNLKGETPVSRANDAEIKKLLSELR